MAESHHAGPPDKDESQRLRARVAQLEEELSRFRSSSGPEDSVVTLIRRLMEDAPVGFAFLNTNFRYEVVNDRLAKMNGVPAFAHIGRTVEEIAPHMAAQLRPAFDKVLATGKPLLDMELTTEMANEPGILRHWLRSLYPMFAADGRLLGVGSVATEITEQKRALEALRMNQQRLELAQAAGGTILWEWDLQANEMRGCAEYGRLYGLPLGEVTLTYEKWLGLIHPDDREGIRQVVGQALAGLDECSSEFRVVWPGGTIHWLSCKGRVFRDSGGSP